jgi:hypothetical protein
MANRTFYALKGHLIGGLLAGGGVEVDLAANVHDLRIADELLEEPEGGALGTGTYWSLSTTDSTFTRTGILCTTGRGPWFPWELLATGPSWDANLLRRAPSRSQRPRTPARRRVFEPAARVRTLHLQPVTTRAVWAGGPIGSVCKRRPARKGRGSGTAIF